MIGFLGGGFDPVHYGHIKNAQAIYEVLKLQQLRFMPYASSPDKPAPLFTDTARLDMLALALKDVQGSTLQNTTLHNILIDTREINQSQTNYTLDTLKNIRKDFPNESICFLMGADSFNNIHTWKNHQQLTNYCHLVVFNRQNHTLNTDNIKRFKLTEQDQPLHNSQSGYLLLLNLAKFDISSSAIRDKIAKQQSLIGLMPKSVVDYISQI